MRVSRRLLFLVPLVAVCGYALRARANNPNAGDVPEPRPTSTSTSSQPPSNVTVTGFSATSSIDGALHDATGQAMTRLRSHKVTLVVQSIQLQTEGPQAGVTVQAVASPH